jgi:DNA-binding NarL/FixJ family response regulator
MRVVLIGRPTDRDRLRAETVDTGLEIVGEAASVAAAREANLVGDAYLLASPTSGGDANSRSEPDEPEVADEPLTPRELEVLSLLAEGLPNKVIATRLAISDQTVKFHVAAIIGKLGAINRTDAVRRGVRRGMVFL